MMRASNGMHMRDSYKIIAVTNLCPNDFEVLLRLSHGRFRMIQQNARRRASEPHDVWIEGGITAADLSELIMRNCDYPGSIRVREVAV
jgi:hypothetical protein